MTKPPHQQELHHEQDRKKLDVTFSRKNKEDNNRVITVGALVLLLFPLPSGKLVVLAKGLNLSTLAIMMSVCTATVEARL
jgi:hypothetical protein